MKSSVFGGIFLGFSTMVLLSGCGDTDSRRNFKTWLQEYRDLAHQIIFARHQMEAGLTNSNSEKDYQDLINRANGEHGLLQRLTGIEKGLRKSEKILCQQEMKETLNELTAYQNELQAKIPPEKK